MTTSVTKIVWVAVVAGAVWLMTGALWDTVYIEPTDDAIATERDGMRLLLLTTLVLVAAGAVAYVVFRAPLWAGALVGLAGVFAYGLATTDVAAILAVLFVYPCALAGVVGCTVAPRRS